MGSARPSRARQGIGQTTYLVTPRSETSLRQQPAVLEVEQDLVVHEHEVF